MDDHKNYRGQEGSKSSKKGCIIAAVETGRLTPNSKIIVGCADQAVRAIGIQEEGIHVDIAFTRSAALHATVGNRTATDLRRRIGDVAPENAVTHGSAAAAGVTQASTEDSRITILHKGAVDHSGTAVPVPKPASSPIANPGFGGLIPGENAVDDGWGGVARVLHPPNIHA